MDLKLIIKYTLPVLIIFLVIFIFFKFIFILAPFAIAYILNFGLKPFVNILERRDLSHTLSVIIVFLGAFSLLTIFFILFIPAVTSEVSEIQNKFDKYASVIKEKFDVIQSKFSAKSNFKKDDMDEGIRNFARSFLRNLAGLLYKSLPLFLYIGIIPFATFFFLLDDVKIKKKLLGYVPNRYFETTLLLLFSLQYQMGMLLRGMFASATIISILAAFGLWIIDLDYHILIGIFAGLSNLIPYVGPIVGTFAACIVAVMTTQAPIFFIYIVVVFLLVNLVDNVFVQPIVMSKAANLHPLIVIILVLLGSKAGGIIGMFMAVPLASLIQVILTILYTEIKRPRKPPFSDYKINNIKV